MKGVIVLVGCGAIGSTAAPQLTRLGRLRIIDRDVVERKNLTTGFAEGDIGKAKATVVAGRLRGRDVFVSGGMGRAAAGKQANFSVEGVVAELNSETVSLLEGAAVIVDGTDNMETRLLINDWCVKHRVPWVYGGVAGLDGAGGVFSGRPCFRCVFPSGGGENCETAGADRRTVELVAGWQTKQVKQLVEGNGRAGVFFRVGEQEEWDVQKDENCECCAKQLFPFLAKRPARVTELCGSGFLVSGRKPDWDRLRKRLEREGNYRIVTGDKDVLSVVVEGKELTVFRDGRVLVRGVTAGEAKRVAGLLFKA